MRTNEVAGTLLAVQERSTMRTKPFVALIAVS